MIPPEPLSATAAARALPHRSVLDVRPAEAFARGHLRGSGHLPIAEFHARRVELPPRDAPVLVVAADSNGAAAGATVLASLDFTDVRWLDAPVDSLAAAGWAPGPGARLWRPNAFLADVLAALPRGLAADLAAGSGRDAVFLALHGFEVEAWDAAPEVLARGAALAVRHEVSIRTVTCDLERLADHGPDPGGPRLEPERYDLIACFRYLHRPLFPLIARALAPGGHVVYETYRAGQEQFGRPRRQRFLLAPGELRTCFPTLEVLRYHEPSPPGGPWTAQLLARRPPA